MQRAASNSELRTLFHTMLLGAGLAVGVAVLGGEKIVYEDNPGKSDLPDADARKNPGREKFDPLDRRSSVSGVVSVPEIPFVLMPRSKKQQEQIERQKNFLLAKPEEPGGKVLTPEEALGVREEDWSTEPAKTRARSSFEQYIVGDEGPAGKKKQDNPLADMMSAGERFGFDVGRMQIGSLALIPFAKEKKQAGPQVEQPDLFGGTMTSSPFSSPKSLKEKEKTQSRRDDWARLLDPHADTVQKELKGLSPLKATPGEGSSIEPVAAFGVDSTRREIGAAAPISPNSRGVDDLVQRREELLSPFQPFNKARSSLSFGTLDPTGSRFLNFNSSPNLVPTVVTPTAAPRPGVLEFPSRKF